MGSFYSSEYPMASVKHAQCPSLSLSITDLKGCAVIEHSSSVMQMFLHNGGGNKALSLHPGYTNMSSYASFFQILLYSLFIVFPSVMGILLREVKLNFLSSLYTELSATFSFLHREIIHSLTESQIFPDV